jgi:cytochrome d ubiquinol oxidase subunit II
VLLTVLGLLGIKLYAVKEAWFKAWFCSALTIVGATFFGVIGLVPTLFPSSIDKAFSLTAHNAASSPMTLKIMLTVALIFVPVVICYQAWAYNLFKGKITPENLVDEGIY